MDVVSWFGKKKPPGKPPVPAPPRQTFGVAYTANIVKHLKPKKTYRFVHKRKGIFVGRYMEQLLDADGDILLRVVVDTSIGSGAEHLANAKMYSNEGVKLQPDIAEKLLKASLVQSYLTEYQLFCLPVHAAAGHMEEAFEKNPDGSLAEINPLPKFNTLAGIIQSAINALIISLRCVEPLVKKKPGRLSVSKRRKQIGRQLQKVAAL